MPVPAPNQRVRYLTQTHECGPRLGHPQGAQLLGGLGVAYMC
jgi:hypothetical protein